MGTALVCDLWGRGRECALSLTANKAGVVVMMVISVILAYLLPNNIIALATAMFMGLCASAFLPTFAYSVFAKKPSQQAALWSICTGSVVWLVWAAFVNVRVSNLFRWGTDPGAPTLAQALLGNASLLPFPWSSMDPLVVALPLSCSALIIAWAVLRNPAGSP
jgi:SSS family solute:Na+ symporter